MPATLSPFRYIQVARYVIQWWLDAAPGFAARRKAARDRAAQFIYAPRMGARTRALAAATVLSDENAGLRGKSNSATAASAETSSDPNNYTNTNMTPTPAPKASLTLEPGYMTPYPATDVPLPPPAPRPARPDRVPDNRYNTEIYRLMNDDRAYVPGAMKPPREIVVLCHGLYGFSTATPIPLFPSLKLHYWASVLEVLRDRMGAKVVVVGVKGTGSIEERAEQMHAFLKSYLPKGVGVNFVAHSMGGLDCRHLISSIRPTEYKPLSLTTIATPHQGSPFMDWCAANIGVGSLSADAQAADLGLPFSLKSPLLARAATAVAAAKAKESDALSSMTSALTNYLLNIFDSPAYHNLTTTYLRDHFNPATPDDPNVKYLSVAGRLSKMSVLHPLWFPKLVLDSAAEKGYPASEVIPGQHYEGNDGLVSVASAKWGEFLGVVDGCHHWDLRGEGGLWPTGTSLKPAAEETQLRIETDSALGLESPPADPCSSAAEHPTGKRDSQLDPAQHARDLATARAMSPVDKETTSQAASSSSSSSWDLAQVGQVIDWVADLFPGDKKRSEPTSQLADARREMEARGGAGAARRAAKKIVRDKFDLERFYGGLMLRLREEGL